LEWVICFKIKILLSFVLLASCAQKERTVGEWRDQIALQNVGQLVGFGAAQIEQSEIDAVNIAKKQARVELAKSIVLTTSTSSSLSSSYDGSKRVLTYQSESNELVEEIELSNIQYQEFKNKNEVNVVALMDKIVLLKSIDNKIDSLMSQFLPGTSDKCDGLDETLNLLYKSKFIQKAQKLESIYSVFSNNHSRHKDDLEKIAKIMNQCRSLLRVVLPSDQLSIHNHLQSKIDQHNIQKDMSVNNDYVLTLNYACQAEERPSDHAFQFEGRCQYEMTAKNKIIFKETTDTFRARDSDKNFALTKLNVKLHDELVAKISQQVNSRL
jgi:plasmid maintenance system killer protein